MRRYELMLVLRPDAPDDRVQAVLDRTTRQITEPAARSSRQPRGAAVASRIPIDRYREGSYHILHFDAPAEAIVELERTPAHHRGGPPPSRRPRRASRPRRCAPTRARTASPTSSGPAATRRTRSRASS